MRWERNLRTGSTTPSGRNARYSSGKKKGFRRGQRKQAKLTNDKCGGGGGGVGSLPGDAEGGNGDDGRPSIGTWTKVKSQFQILMEITGMVSYTA